jgi:hypothetical protein
MDEYRTIVHPVVTESAMKKIEDHNTLVFVVDLKVRVLVPSYMRMLMAGIVVEQASDQDCCQEAVRC